MEHFGTSTSNRPPIPDPMKRQVRQRCGFGCVICGKPLYTYEHILGYANVQRHIADELTLLCDQHQRESTNKLLPREHIIRANKDPYNLRKGVSAPYTLHYEGPDCIVDVGANVFSFRDDGYGTEFVALAIDDDPIISFKLDSDHWLLSLNVLDKNGDLILQIADNELTYSIIPWDIELVGHNLIIREAQGEIFLDLLFEPPSRIKIQRGHLLHNGIEVEIHHGYLQIMNDGTKMVGCSTDGHTRGILLGNMVKPDPWGFHMPIMRRNVTGHIDSP
jgi:hypothetical protein